MDVLVGASEIDITPPAGLPMDGYLARGSATSQGTHDPLRAQVLALDNGKWRLVLVTLDVLAVSNPFTGNLQHAIASLAATNPANVMVAASHTHAGPAGLQDWFPMGARPRTNPELASAIQTRILEATRQALSRLKPVTFSFASSQVQGIGMDQPATRRRPVSHRAPL
jgi:predicted neutral ceramidase superfamily lipid hydrolase